MNKQQNTSLFFKGSQWKGKKRFKKIPNFLITSQWILSYWNTTFELRLLGMNLNFYETWETGYYVKSNFLHFIQNRTFKFKNTVSFLFKKYVFCSWNKVSATNVCKGKYLLRIFLCTPYIIYNSYSTFPLENGAYNIYDFCNGWY